MLLGLKTVPRWIIVLAVFFLAWTPVAYGWSWPVQGPVLQPFAYDEAHPYAAGQHRGMDIGAGAAGDGVVAPAAGTISFAGTVPTSGKTVTIETPDGYSVTLTHLGSIVVVKNAAVAEGAPLGTVGPSGTPEVEGPYVHLGIRVTADPNGYVDPLGLLPPPAAESPPADGSSPVPESSPSTSASAPPVTASGRTSPATPEESVGRPTSIRVSRHDRGRAAASRAETARPRSSQQPAFPAEPAAETSRAAAKADRPPGRPASSVRRPVVEAAPPARPLRLDAGHELRPSVTVEARVGKPLPQAPGALLPLLLNGLAALVAVAAAIAAARRRRYAHAGTGSRVGAEVFRLPPRLFEHRRAA
jgi:Peptidase family M23